MARISEISRIRNLVSVARKREAKLIQNRAQTMSQDIIKIVVGNKKVVVKKWGNLPKTNVLVKIKDKE